MKPAARFCHAIANCLGAPARHAARPISFGRAHIAFLAIDGRAEKRAHAPAFPAIGGKLTKRASPVNRFIFIYASSVQPRPNASQPPALIAKPLLASALT